MSEAPFLRVVRGEPDDAELAALLAVLAASAADAERPAAPAASPWRDRARSLHAPVLPGPGAWRAASLPQ